MNWAEVLGLMAAVFVANIGVIIPLFLWTRAEANADRREASAERSVDRKDILQLIREIQTEMKDFHARLYSIEERNKAK